MKHLALLALPLLIVAACSSGGGNGGTDNALLQTPSEVGVEFDASTGVGFVGNVDAIREVLDWTQEQLEANANSLQFRAASVTEVGWVCQNVNNANQTRQERQLTTTLEGLGVLVEREGGSLLFVLTGYVDVEPIVTIDGPAIDYCPAFKNNNTNNDNPDNWVLLQPAGDPTPVGDTTLMVSGDDGRMWLRLP
jgi:hypothetical protein